VSITDPKGNLINVVKRDGTTEQSDSAKIDKVLTHAINGYKHVSLDEIKSQVEVRIHNQIPTKEIQGLLVQSTADLITPRFSEYQYVGAKLQVFNIRKEAWGCKEPPTIWNFYNKNAYNPETDKGIYDETLLNDYTEEDFNRIETMIDHKRDFRFTHAGIQQMVDKYLISDRLTKHTKETPQFAYILIAMSLFRKYEGEKRFEYVKKCYDYISTFKINLPTPIMAGARTKLYQYSSCVLVDIDDSIDGIGEAVKTAMRYVADRAGLGLNIGRLRARNSMAGASRQTQVITTGIVPFLKIFESTVKSTSQNGLRVGSATVNFPFWHTEIMGVLNLKNNAGTDDNRVRHLDYVIQFSMIFYDRFIKREDITLFSPHDVPDLYEAFGLPEFDELYEKYEKELPEDKKRSIPAVELMEKFLKERLETGRFYVMNIDHCNDHGSFKERVTMTNLCVEITHPTKPIKSVDDPEAEVGVCVLSAVNIGEVETDEEIETACDIIARLLDEVIDLQEYPVDAAARFTQKRRSLGVGISNMAYYLAKNNANYEDPKAWELADEISEKIQYNLLKASNELAREKGKCELFHETKYADGVLPIDTYKRTIDTIITRKPSEDWEGLRAKIVKDGLRHSTLTAVMPVESSSVIQNSTNGVEPPRSLLTTKKSKTGAIKILAPECGEIGHQYTLAYEMENNRGYISVIAAIQKWFDMSISANLYYDYTNKKYEDGKIPLSELAKDLLYAYSMGVKTLYYSNTNDGNGEDEQASGCVGGACTL
jgi:ribonucleoside-diphosphate reductase alpha chain